MRVALVQSTYLSTDQVRARFGGVSRMWVARAIRAHGFPHPLKFGDRSSRGRAFYSLAAIERWERIQSNQSTYSGNSRTSARVAVQVPVEKLQ